MLCTALTACAKGGAKDREAEAKPPPPRRLPRRRRPPPHRRRPPRPRVAAAGPLSKLDVTAPELDVAKSFAGYALSSEHGSLPDEVWDVLWVRDAAGKQVVAAHMFTDAAQTRAVNLVAAVAGVMPSQGDVGMSLDDLRQKVKDVTCVYPDDGESPVMPHRTHTDPSADWVVCYSPREGGDRNPFAYIFVDDGQWKIDGENTKASAGAKVKYVAWEDDKNGPSMLGLPAAAAKPAP
ncbi:MAG: hypothetical protein IPL61_00845 [Myxococcales bacterium]|nr:hypothetical protein [Myxococcales bacterium]